MFNILEIMQNLLNLSWFFTVLCLTNQTLYFPLFLFCLPEESSAVEEATDSMQELSVEAGSIAAAASEDPTAATETAEPAPATAEDNWET